MVLSVTGRYRMVQNLKNRLSLCLPFSRSY